MDIHEAIAISQERLAGEGATMHDLLGRLRDRISPVLIGEQEWEHLLARAGTLPITMGAQPFGFELPLHDRRPRADFGVSRASGSGTAGGTLKTLGRRTKGCCRGAPNGRPAVGARPPWSMDTRRARTQRG